MAMIRTFLLAAVYSLTLTVHAQPPASADAVVKAACKEAAASHKKVFLLFHASWCGWCHRMDSIMAAPVCKPLFDGQYIITHLVILENGDKQALDNPGAMDLYNKYADAKTSGIPFFLIINPDGTVVQDSRIKPEGAAPGSTGANTGCPDSEAELAYFVRVLHETSSLSDAQIETIRAEFARHKNKAA
jgi:thiol-disulfide isomerase/thioredoxin